MRKNALIGLIGLFVGAALILGIRFVRYQPREETHYHANFAVYVNGEREAFRDVSYYEETGGVPCAEEETDTPGSRTHMHGNVNDVVHVEDEAVTWGHFFQVLGWDIGDEFIKTDGGLLVADGDNKLTYILNGEPAVGIAGRVIDDRDKLLVSYGADQDTVGQYGSIADTAEKYNLQKDPAGCGGSAEPSFRDRLRTLF